MGFGIIRLSEQFVLLQLQLPNGWQARGFSFDASRKQLILQVEHDSIPDVDEGELLPVVTPVYGPVEPSADRLPRTILVDIEIRDAKTGGDVGCMGHLTRLRDTG